MENKKFFFLQPVSTSRSSLNRRFIYALLLPLKRTEGKLVPWFLGDTTQITKRLANHKEVNWFNKKYKEPVPVLVLGTVADFEAFEARQDLAHVLHNSKVLLAPANVTWTPRVKLLSFHELPDYACQVPDLQSLLPAWEARWDVKIRKATQPPQLPVNAPLLALRKQQLIDYCSQMNFATETERRIVMNIVHVYSDYEGNSQYTLSAFESNWLKKTKHTKIRKVFNFPSTVSSGSTVFFYPQQSVVNKILKPV